MSGGFVKRCVLSFLCSFVNMYVILCVVYLQLNYYCFTVTSSDECLDPGDVANATYTITGLSIGSTVTYMCDSGYQYEAGYLTRICQSDSTWDGVPPVCSGMSIHCTSIKYNTNNDWTLSEKWKIIKMTVLILISQSYHHTKRDLCSKYIWFTCKQHPPQSTYYQRNWVNR